MKSLKLALTNPNMKSCANRWAREENEEAKKENLDTTLGLLMLGNNHHRASVYGSHGRVRDLG
jgi:hypothetical protein